VVALAVGLLVLPGCSAGGKRGGTLAPRLYLESSLRLTDGQRIVHRQVDGSSDASTRAISISTQHRVSREYRGSLRDAMAAGSGGMHR